jgi:uncharacterized protein YaaN involved in tellurite resistance
MSDSQSRAPAPAEPREAEVVAFGELPPERRRRVEALMAAIDLASSQTIVGFAAEAQRELTAVSEQILEGVRNKDTGQAGAALNQMMLRVRDIELGALKDGREPGWFQRVVLRRASPLARFLQQYETVRGQIDRIHAELESHRLKMVQDVARLDKLYEVTLEFFRNLSDHIVAAEERLRRLDAEELPRLKAEAERGTDMLASQRLADLANARNDLERKLHDLKLTRQVTMQSLPSIRLNQDLDKSLVGKIQSVLANTLPLWKNQLAQAVTLFRTHQAAETLQFVNRTTNELLEANAAGLRQANVAVRGAVEEGVFSIESVERANANLLAAIEESIELTEEGRRRRKEAEGRLVEAEQALKRALQATAGRPG